MNNLKKINKKYVNRKYLKNICLMHKKLLPYKIIAKSKKRLTILTLDEFKKALRTIIIDYLKNGSELAILTSKKLSK
jgi:hypothetical protein